MGAPQITPVDERDEHVEHVELGALATSLGFMLRIAQLRNFERFYARFGHLDLKPGEFSILWVVNLNPGIRQGVLAHKLQVKPAHMTKIIRRLEGQGIIARHIPDGDRRSVELSLTERGLAFVEERQADFFGADNYNDTDLTPEEKRQLAALLTKYCGTSEWRR
ncbi:MarR family winged helix-turn-helix transcriptional regulator [Pseudoroseicyclus tamaricis]|uniref:MarR family transcriptional regulator n=1 Tax=Pseudoroseicyclus tamaricis TaxID=2705421 RepID=A0A6B2JSH8_9RHOB|nr:MarR family transcriptional regulator [Pseudoroseicyclus tamaricis]NDV00950.1 MarR family transcriptional regulator [Pseudoroseicyclus tamaricis]